MITPEYIIKEFDGLPNAIENSYKTMLSNLDSKSESLTKLIFSNEVDQASLTICDIQSKDFDFFADHYDQKHRK